MSIDPTGDLTEHIARLTAEVADLKRRLRNKSRTGVIEQVDAGRGLVRVRLNEEDGQPFLTGWIPWKERAGAIKSWSPPSPGEQVVVISENGDLTDAYCDTGCYSNANPAPHNRAAEHVLTIGDARITMTGSSIELRVGGSRVLITAAEIVTYGQTRLDDGQQPVHRVGDLDSDGDAAVDGAPKVFA